MFLEIKFLGGPINPTYYNCLVNISYSVFSLNRPTGPIPSLSLNVRQSSVCVCHCWKPAYRWTGDFGLKSVSIILTYLWTFLDLLFLWFFCALKCFRVFYITVQCSKSNIDWIIIQKVSNCKQKIKFQYIYYLQNCFIS